MSYDKEQKMVREVSKRLFVLVDRELKNQLSTTSKSAAHDVVSTIDLAADRLLVHAISRHFPKDALITEESSPAQSYGTGRTWVVDPICGSGNCARGIRLFVTNIALVQDNAVIAAWVIDYNRERIIWSTGDGLYEGGNKLPPMNAQKSFPTIDVNQGYLHLLNARIRRSYVQMMAGFLSDQHKCSAILLHSSISFVLIATGQLQGAISPNINAWDFAAGAFLVEQAGGRVTNFDGSPWGLDSRSVVMSMDHSLHRRFLVAIARHRLQNLI